MSEVEERSQIVNDPGFFKNLCCYIVKGGTLVEFSEEYQLDFYMLKTWLRSDDARSKAYSDAEEMRREVVEDKLFAEIRDISMMDIAKCYDDEGKMLPIKDLPPSITKAIKSVERDGDKVKLQFLDKLRAIEQFAKTTKIFKEKIEIGVDDSLEALIDASFNKE